MVTMELSKVTSKTSSIKALLLKAWRERWTDLQWGIHIKSILPRGVSGDVYNLAECILQQALIGPGPNHLVLSYLRHSLSSQLISYKALLQHISKYTSFNKPHCILSLLELLETNQVGITTRGKNEEGVLAASMLSTILWLLQCYLYHLNKITSGTQQSVYEEIGIKCAELLTNMLASDFFMAMIYLAKHDDDSVYGEVLRKCKEIEQFLVQNRSLEIPSASSIESCLKKLRHVKLNVKTECEPVTYCLQPLLAVEIMLNPGCETSYLVDKLIMLQRLKGYSNPRLYCDIMRAFLISLNSVLGTSEEAQWGAFTILKLPHIFQQLHKNLKDDSTQNNKYSQDIVDSFDLLLQLTPLLDIMDSKCSCNFVECILNELLKIKLITSSHVSLINEKREKSTNWIQKIQDNNNSQPLPKVIIKAEPSLSRLLLALDQDNIKMENILSVLSPILIVKSFDLILAVATVEGKLRTFVSKLIKINETCKCGSHSENPKQAQTRALLFDVTFLMLCTIVNVYGSQVVLEENGDSFFELWVRESMVEKGHTKSPEAILSLCDSNKVDALLQQFQNEEFKISQVKWNEVCLNIPGVIKEVLLAWEQGTLGANDVKRILENIRSKLCCLPVCATAWLCSYMQILHQDALLKPMNMVQQFVIASPPPEESSENTCKTERFNLMVPIIRRMQYNICPSTSNKISLQHGIISNTPISTQLEKVWNKIHKQGWVSIEATHQLQSLLNTGASCWFITNVLKEVMKYKYQEDLNRAVDLAFAVFHLDIMSCTLSLLLEVLPQYLHNKLQCDDLVEPQLSALAKVCVYCIIAAAQSTQKDVSNKKRSRKEIESEENDNLFYPPSKQLKMSNGEAAVGFTNNLNSSSVDQPKMAEPLQGACNELFNSFMMIANREGEISQQTHFVYKFLEMMVKCGRDKTRLVLQGQPVDNLMPNLIRWLPDMVSVDLIAGLYDVTTAGGRKAAARDLCMLINLQSK